MASSLLRVEQRDGQTGFSCLSCRQAAYALVINICNNEYLHGSDMEGMRISMEAIGTGCFKTSIASC